MTTIKRGFIITLCILMCFALTSCGILLKRKNNEETASAEDFEYSTTYSQNDGSNSWLDSNDNWWFDDDNDTSEDIASDESYNEDDYTDESDFESGIPDEPADDSEDVPDEESSRQETETSKPDQTVNNGSTINVSPITQSTATIKKITQSSTNVTNALIQTYEGNISRDGQTDEYSFTAPVDGSYRVWITELYSGNSFKLYVYNKLGEAVSYNSHITNGNGITLDSLKAGEAYKIAVIQKNGHSTYKISIGYQKNSVKIGSYTTVNDSIEFTDQCNNYKFTAPRDGNYRFEFSNLTSGSTLYIAFYNYLGERIEYNSYVTNGNGITVSNLKANEEYTFSVKYKNGFSKYTLSIGYQKETVDISNKTVINDSIEYTDQKNVYTFTVPRDGRYRFEFGGMNGGCALYIAMYNHLGERVEYNSYVTNGSGITLDNVKKGEKYTFAVQYKSSFSDYTLFVGMQKPTVAIRKNVTVNDSIEYTDQVNIYALTAESSSYKLSVSGMDAKCSLKIYVYDELNQRVSYNSYYNNGSTLELSGLTVGKQYTVEIIYNSGKSAYTIKVK